MTDRMIWKRSTKCGSGQCVEVGFGDTAIYVRSTDDASGPPLAFGRSAWKEFCASLRKGSFDR